MQPVSNASILVIDDDPVIRRVIESALESAGYTVSSAPDGKTGLSIAQDKSPGLILLDASMPGMDGYEVCAELQRSVRTSLVPVVFVTSRDQPQDKARALAAGAVDYLLKPIKRGTLLETVEKHLDTQSRWYRVTSVTELWDESALPQKFIEFRKFLFDRLHIAPDVQKQVAEVPSGDVYLLTKLMDISYEELAQLMSVFFGLEYLPRVDPESIELGVLPAAFCKKNHIVAIKDPQGREAVVIINPFQWGLAEIDALNNAFRGRPHRLLLTHRQGMRALFTEDAAARVELSSAPAGTDERVTSQPAMDSVLETPNEASAIDMVDALLTDAVRRRASDLHIQAGENRVHVRFRIDGRMREVMPLLPSQLPAIVARLKVMCNMNISESRAPQDGGCRVRIDGRDIDVRASTLPALYGEKVVLRLVGQTSTLQTLDGLGMSEGMLQGFRGLLAARQGMILVTGPTGSGKTTTLYAALQHLNRPELNLITVEDPVEIGFEGITQVQVHERAGCSFAATLRAMLRQDPDIIMVGEIRDAETAEIAARAALTGHLVLSTLHTQHAMGTIIRLLDMGVPAYLAGSALNGVVAQRLAHRVCEGCAEYYEPPAALTHALNATFGSLEGARFRKGRGCVRCHRTGTKGRVGVYELLTIDDDLRDLMTEGAPPRALKAHVQRRGFLSMEQDAFEKACEGIIPPEEIVELGFGAAVAMAGKRAAGSPAPTAIVQTMVEPGEAFRADDLRLPALLPLTEGR